MTDGAGINPTITNLKYIGYYFIPITYLVPFDKNLEIIEKIFKWAGNTLKRNLRYISFKLFGNQNINESEGFEFDRLDYEEWNANVYEKGVSADVEEMEQYEQVEKILASQPSLKSTTPQPYKYKRRFEPLLKVPAENGKFETRNITSDDWLEIIDNANPSRLIPVIFGGISEDAEKYRIEGFNIFRIEKERNVNAGLFWDQYRDTPTLNKVFRTTQNIPEKVLTELKKSIESRFKHTTIICLLILEEKSIN